MDFIQAQKNYLKPKPITNDPNHVKEILVSRIDNKYLSNFYSNQSSLKIELVNNNDYLDKFYARSLYNGIKNKILIERDYYWEYIFHELLHVASTVKGRKVLYIGFKQYDYVSRKSIGCGLNEGMTNYLDNKYFLDIHHTKEMYSLLKHIISYLLGIYEDLLEQWYFNADGYSLYMNLSCYMNKYYTNKFIYATDYLANYIDDTNLDQIITCYKYAIKYINVLYLKIITKQYQNHNLSKVEYDNIIDKFKLFMERDIDINGISVNLISEYEQMDMINGVYKKMLKKTKYY